MTQDNNPSSTVTGETHVDSSAGGENVDTLSLTEINQHLGRNYKDKPTALAALKETFSFVGKRTESSVATAPAADETLVAQVKDLTEEVWYAQHPEYKDMRDTIKAFGKSPSEVIEMPAFKTIFEKVKVADEVAQTRSIAPSNARLAQTQSTTTEAVTIANARGATLEDVATVLARGIIEQSEGQ